MKKAIPLHANIMTIFTVLVVAIVLSVVLYGYRGNSESAVVAAEQLLERIGVSVSEKTQNIFDAAFMTVDTLTSFRDIEEKATIHSHPMGHVFFRFLEQHPDFTSIYTGFADGDFYLVSSLKNRGEMKRQLNIPENAEWYTQHIARRADGQRYELRKYLDAGFVTVGSRSTTEVSYDPRSRSWYKSAIATDAAMLSDAYVFALSGEPGITVSHRFDGNIPGVMGVDLSLANLSDFVRRQAVGDDSQIVLFDTGGNVYAAPEMSGTDLTVSGLSNPVLTALFKDFQSHGEQAMRVHELPINGTTFLSHVDPISFDKSGESNGKKLFVAVAVPEAAFTGPIARIGRHTLFVSVGMLLLFLPIIYIVARRISSPLKKLTKSVERIESFQLDDPIVIRSHIVEIQELTKATETMRTTLKAFGSYIPKPLVEAMIVNHIEPELGGERKEMTFLFSDIKDFTTISESLTPEQVTGSITAYLKEMSGVILENSGTIDKYIGDAIVAFWNAPVEDSSHANHACLAALYCQQILKEFNSTREQEGEKPFLTRIGLHTGEAVVGNIGSSDRMNYTAMGASVNLASRLEGLNKYLGTKILVSEDTVRAAGKSFFFRFAGKVVPKGTTAALGVYELIGTRHSGADAYAPFAVSQQTERKTAEWEDALSLFLNSNFSQAVTAFDSWLEQHGPDSLVEHYAVLAREYQDNPPDDSWKGEFVFNVK